MDATKKIKRIFLSILIVFIAIFVFMTWYKHDALEKAQAERLAEASKGQLVHVIKVIPSLPEHSLSINGETRPYQSVTLYAKVSGYLKNVLVDKGDIVKEGQLLAEIESPETDQAYLAALANFENKNDIARRNIILEKENLISEQEKEQTVADAQIAKSQLNAQKELKAYEQVRAPFAGAITARFADPGALVQNAQAAQSGALPVVTVSEIKRLRVDVFVNQQDAPYVKKDDPVQISLADHSDIQFTGSVDRVADALDPTAKMMLVEIDIPNSNNQIVAGSFVQVNIKIKSPSRIMVPVEALLLKEGKSYAAVVSSENKIQYRSIEIETNDGKQLGLKSGLQEGDIVALNLGDGVQEGSLVRPITQSKGS